MCLACRRKKKHQKKKENRKSHRSFYSILPFVCDSRASHEGNKKAVRYTAKLQASKGPWPTSDIYKA